MKKKIIISADSTCDLSPALVEKYQIKILPLYITFGESSYRDGIEITPDDLYARYHAEGILPKTSAVSIGDFTEYFETLLQEADQVIHFSLSSSLSCTFQNAMLAAEEFPGRLFPVDTENLSTGEALTIIRAAEKLAEGATAEEIVAFSTEYRTRVDASFIVESLEFLYKGGRCNALAAFGSNLMSIKPCIEVQSGKMDVGKKYRGKFLPVLQKYVEERLASGDFETDRIFVTHAGCQDEIVEAVKQQVEATGMFKEVYVTRAGCTISAHCGPNTLGILFVHKS
ncbi:MAG: DegV family protein [Clostridia bacterium]|nr:DegV family protein [Clostridia bacterium]